MTARSDSPADRHMSELARRVELQGKRVLDIGCGRGEMVRRLLRAGADAHGFEVQQDMLDAAVASGVPAQRLKLGDGSALPWPDASFDLVLFVFSFHHVPLDSQPRMLAEVARLLPLCRAGDRHRPRPYGAMSETIKPLEDETHVRTASQALLAAPPAPFTCAEQAEYEIVRSYADADALIASAVAVDPARKARLAQPGTREAVQERFLRLSEPARDGARRLEQPCVLMRLTHGS